MSDDPGAYFQSREAEWNRLEARFIVILLRFCGLSAACIGGLLVAPGNAPAALIVVIAVLGLSSILMAAGSRFEADHCRAWGDYWRLRLSDPAAALEAEFLPAMTGDAR